MAEYAVVVARSARQELERLEIRVARRIVARMEALTMNPRPPGCRKLQGAEDLWRIRIGDYRIIYAIDDDRRVVDIGAVRHRRDAYR